MCNDLPKPEESDPPETCSENVPLPTSIKPTKPRSNWSTRAAWVQAGATVVLVVITAFYAYLTWQSVAATEKMVAATEKMAASTEKTVAVQVNPVITVDTPPGGQATLVLFNAGSTPVLEVVVHLERTLVFGPPASEIMGPLERVFCGPPYTCAFWTLPKLEPGQRVEQSFLKEAASALGHAKRLNEARIAGRMEAPKKVLDSSIHPILSFRVAFLREVDRKPFSLERAVLVLADSQSGKPYIMDSRMASVVGYFRETLGVLDRGVGAQ